MHTNSPASQFLLRKDVTFLNFGSFGACIRPAFERYQQYQLELEEEPVRFITVNGPEYLKQSRQALGEYLNCSADDVVYVTNPSYAVNIIAKSFDLKEGDEILTTNLEYGACDRTWRYYCKKSGAKWVKFEVPFPLTTKEEFVEQFMKMATEKTRLIFISHLTSSTGLRLPVEEICKAAREKGILTFVDGAHGPGQVPVDLTAMDVDMYTGACHKWMMTPKGSSFLYVKREHQHLFDPLIISWGYEAAKPSHSQFLDYHQLQGTRDFSAFLTIPVAIDFMKQHHWPEVNAAGFCKLLGSSPIAPVNDDFIAQLYSAQIKTSEPEKLHHYFFDQYKIEIPVMPHGDKVYLRYSIQAFNSQADLDKLFNAIKDIKQTTSLIEE
jgi:isopenicillin-N epimerase